MFTSAEKSKSNGRDSNIYIYLWAWDLLLVAAKGRKAALKGRRLYTLFEAPILNVPIWSSARIPDSRAIQIIMPHVSINHARIALSMADDACS